MERLGLPYARFMDDIRTGGLLIGGPPTGTVPHLTPYDDPPTDQIIGVLLLLRHFVIDHDPLSVTVMSAVVFSSGSSKEELSLTSALVSGFEPHR